MRSWVIFTLMQICWKLCRSQDLDTLVGDSVRKAATDIPAISATDIRDRARAASRRSQSTPQAAPAGQPGQAGQPGGGQSRGSTRLKNLFSGARSVRPSTARSDRGGRIAESSLRGLQGRQFRGRNVTLREVQPLLFKHLQPFCGIQQIVCDSNAPYRTADGTCNNLFRVRMGAADTPQSRFISPEYGDYWNWGVLPRIRGKNGDLLISPRKISNLIFKAVGFTPKSNRRNVVAMTHFGQFVDHDVTKTPIFTDLDGDIECCDGDDPISPLRPECFPFKTPPGDFRFDCMNFVRSRPACVPGQREQVNLITSWLDLSSVYGSSLEEQTELRANNGKLKVGDNDNLPDGQDTCENNLQCFLAGDDRSSEIPLLAIVHILFMREHNRIADKLSGKGWNSEKIFQETRKILTGIYQHIVYNEFLPAVLGSSWVKYTGLKSRKKGLTNWYSSWIDGATHNAFGTAAYRMGHSLVGNFVGASNSNFQQQRTSPLKEEFFDTKTIRDKNQWGAERIGRWMCTKFGRRMDGQLTDQVRNHLFEGSPGDALDLGALNIQRGRDHGLPGYNKFRQFCGLKPALYFSNGPGGFVDHSSSTVNKLSQLYRHVDDVDLFAGGLSERPKSTKTILGPTFRCLITLQFLYYKYGDRFFYENNFPKTGFTVAQVNSIKKQTMARIFCSGLKLNKIQRRVFFKKKRINCNKLPDLDFDLF